ncbi:MAG: RIP metalloprotease RseP [Gammaproteobacteria bacterium]|nr:RIP metalloprotease RseP [Gammaproteobacteria bacterium]
MNILDILYNLFFFLVALGVLVTFHEWGHFYAARKLGVKVLRFSVGFGKPLFKKVGKDGVEYVIAGIPLGGYVKMLDEREADVPDDQKAFAFNRQPVWKRNIIVFAGPFANFVLALALYWVMFLSGTWVFKAVVEQPPEQSIAASAGLNLNDQIVEVDGTPVTGWKEVSWALVERLGEQGEISLRVIDVFGHERDVLLSINDWAVDERRPDVLGSLGLQPKKSIPPVLGEVSEGLPADLAGLRTGDLIVEMNKKPIASFNEISLFMSKVSNNEPIELIIENESGKKELLVAPELNNGRWIIGVMPMPMYEFHQAGPLDSILLAYDETVKVLKLTATTFVKLITGEVSPKALGGPIAIAEGAGASARGGWVYFLSFLGMISVNLGLINLLPVPVLDGGHLLFNTLEWLKGKPLSESAQEYGMRIGIVLVLGLMAIAFINDIARL